ncbi:hypothetical protein YDYSG_56820 [Paenibacillus tyrfis]|uniref:hypothetical protein n=1 Tax=Paenibacillus tyrfis TaxID=1501230 RepID=UPI0024914752|nr:hypothetical protein [Paenibacillus tyrfis]GLI09650.1 hypothetical protein YDYSG_56820 [Paenibacillus tyrfis]
MKTSKTKDFRNTFLLNERKLRELETILNKVSDEITYEIDCIEGTQIKFSNLEDLLKYPNRKEKQYKTIEVRTPYHNDIHVSVRFSSEGVRSLNYRVSGEERDVDHFSAQIEGFLMSLGRWYDFIGKTNFLINMSSALLFYLLVSLPFIQYLDTSTVWAIFPSMFLVIMGFDKFREYLFPVASFEFGDGIERNKIRSNIRAYILGGVILAAVVGYFVNQLPSITSLSK